MGRANSSVAAATPEQSASKVKGTTSHPFRRDILLCLPLLWLLQTLSSYAQTMAFRERLRESRKSETAVRKDCLCLRGTRGGTFEGTGSKEKGPRFVSHSSFAYQERTRAFCFMPRKKYRPKRHSVTVRITTFCPFSPVSFWLVKKIRTLDCLIISPSSNALVFCKYSLLDGILDIVIHNRILYLWLS